MHYIADEKFDLTLINNHNFDALILPGGLKGAQIFRENLNLMNTVKAFMQDETKIVGSICASPAVVLAGGGLLEGRESVTCYPGLKDKLKVWTDQPVARSGNLITSQGPGTAIEFAISLISALWDEALALRVKKELMCK